MVVLINRRNEPVFLRVQMHCRKLVPVRQSSTVKEELYASCDTVELLTKEGKQSEY